jgi:hypothetical protein
MEYNLTDKDIKNGPTLPPKDAMRLGVFGDYELWYDNKKKNMIFHTIDYHPGTLNLSKEGLEKMIAVLSGVIAPEEIRAKDTSD